MMEFGHGILKGVGKQRPGLERVFIPFPEGIALEEAQEIEQRLHKETLEHFHVEEIEGRLYLHVQVGKELESYLKLKSKLMFPQKIILKDGSEILFRRGAKEDAEEQVAYVKQVADETDFLTFSSEDFNKTVEEEAQFLQEYEDKPRHVFFVAVKEGEIVAALDVSSSHKPRMKHIGHLGISVMKSEWGKGIATEMMKLALDWAQLVGLRKMNLEVDTRNTRAIALYERLGFEMEGTQRRDGFIDGEFRDAHLMGLLID